MEVLIYTLGWGSPVGIGLFLLLLSISMRIFFDGVSKIDTKKKSSK